MDGGQGPFGLYQILPPEFDERIEVRIYPDFSGCDLHRKFEMSGAIGGGSSLDMPLSRANFSDANFRGANLYRANLTQANLWKADLRDAQMYRVDLSGADLSGADLRNANLVMAKFDGARLDFANLQGAHLTFASFENAQLHETNLAGAYLGGTGLRKAQLWPEIDRVSQCEEFQPSLSDVTDMVRTVELLQRYYRDRGDLVRFYFRGEGNSSWRLMPSIMRSERGKESENVMLVALAARRPEELSKVPSALGQWVLAQHHGLQTRFLDITRNPLVGLFHACEEVQHRDVSGKLHIFAVGNDLVKSFDSDSIAVIANFAKLAFEDKSVLLVGTGGFHDSDDSVNANCSCDGSSLSTY